jgi:DMSO/TMAO reductase YedYZ molybdopterin-dependent catalytic subunit/multisubunit Na+/H+ antiporter MnhB subunit
MCLTTQAVTVDRHLAGVPERAYGRDVILRTRRAGRRTNLALLAVLTVAFATGLTAETLGTPGLGRWVVAAHGVAGLAVALLTPWKTRVAQRGLRRRNARRAVSVVVAAMMTVVLVTGVLNTVGVPERIGRFTVLWVHIAVALALVPLLGWHVVARKTLPRSTDLTRRNVLRLGGVASAATVAWWAGGAAVGGLGLRGADRRFTGSHETASLQPDELPVTQWLDDEVPRLSADGWALTVRDELDVRRLTLGDVGTLPQDDVPAVLDCTSGWWSLQSWQGVRLDRLVSPGDARSVVVTSVTGYARRFPAAELDRLWLVTGVGGAALRAGNGFPARLVAPGRRGFWWVKWVTRIETSPVPWWLQSPFPLT